MKVLEVFGDDYAAVMYERGVEAGEIKPLELWLKARAEGQQEAKYDYTHYEYIAREFGEVDPSFIRFVQDDLYDYDDSKHHNFYILD